MTLEWITGTIALGPDNHRRQRGRPPRAMGERVLQMFLRHALARRVLPRRQCTRATLKIAPNGDLVALDFGIMGRLDEYTRRVYAEILMGFIRKDYRRVAEVHLRRAMCPPTAISTF